MGAFGRLFGLGLVLAGIFIAIYWTAWLFMILVRYPSYFLIFNLQPCCANSKFSSFFLEPIWIFRLPALALIGGIAFINRFIISTNKKIAAARAAAAAKAAENNQKKTA